MNPGSSPRVEADRFEVRSADGTSIAVWVDGEGPPLLLVHGALNDHTTDLPFVAELRDRLTTFALDRRGRGASGDAAAYAIEREFEDVAAAVDAVAARPTGGGVGAFVRRRLQHGSGDPHGQHLSSCSTNRGSASTVRTTSTRRLRRSRTQWQLVTWKAH